MLQVDSYVWAGCADGRIFCIEAKTGKIATSFTAHKKEVLAMCIVNESVWTGGGDGAIHVWSRKKLGKMKVPVPLKGHSAPVTVISFYNSPNKGDGTPGEVEKQALTTSKSGGSKQSGKAASKECVSGDSDGEIIVWKAETKVRRMSVSGSVGGLRILPRGEGKARVWVGTSNALYVLEMVPSSVSLVSKFSMKVSDLLFLPSSNKMWAATPDGPITIWDPDEVKQLGEVGVERIAKFVTANDETGRPLVWCTNGKDSFIYVVDGRNPAVLNRLDNTEKVTAFCGLEGESPQVWSSGELLAMTRWHFSGYVK